MFEDDEDLDDYAENYSEGQGMTPISDRPLDMENSWGHYMAADNGCRSNDNYGGKRRGGGRKGDYDNYNWYGRELEENDDDSY